MIATHSFLDVIVTDFGPMTRKDIFVLLCSILLFSPMLFGCAGANSLVPPSATPSSTATASLTPTLTLTPSPTLTPTPTEIPAACGGPRVMYILLIGSDARADTYDIGLADAIRIARVDFVEKEVQILTFPRDLYVEIPGIKNHNGITHGKLNQAFLYGNPGYGYFDGYGQGPGLLALTLKKNFGAQTDHYVALNLQTFSKFVDALGGIDIYMPYALDGRVQGSRDPDRYFPAGDQHLNGYRTMLLARMRPKGDIQRTEIQNMIIDAIASKLLAPSTLPKLIKLTSTFRGSVQTNISPTQIGQLSCLSAFMDPQEIEYINFPDGLFKNGRVKDPVLGNTSILEADFEVLRIYVQEFQKEMAPKPDPKPDILEGDL